MKRHSVVLGLLVLLMLSGCGYKEGVSTGARESFLYFTGNVASVSVSIDGGEQFAVESGRSNQYRISPGKHRIRVFRKGKLVVDREVYVGDGVSKEIRVE